MKILAVSLVVAWCVMPLPAMAAEDNNPAERVGAGQSQDDGDHNHRRQHFLYDSEYQPNTDALASRTDAMAPRAGECAGERVRVPRGDGTTSVTRIDKCR